MKNIFLIGYRCTGKTSVGKALAEKLGRAFTDTDAEIVKAQGITISEMVSRYGWEFFREKEREILRRVSARDNCIIATGGGIILNPENVEAMKQTGDIIWLKASPEIIKERILQDQQTDALRPSLTSKGLVEEIEDVLSVRTPLYEKAADFSIATDQLGIDDICRETCLKLKIDN